jgi:hypothetical protein
MSGAAAIWPARTPVDRLAASGLEAHQPTLRSACWPSCRVLTSRDRWSPRCLRRGLPGLLLAVSSVAAFPVRVTFVVMASLGRRNPGISSDTPIGYLHRSVFLNQRWIGHRYSNPNSPEAFSS